MGRLAVLVIRHRIPIIVAAFLVTVFFGWSLRDLRVNADILSYLPPDDPVARLNAEISDRFGGSQLAVVILEAPAGEPLGVFNPATLSAVADLTRELQQVEGIRYVTSLTSALDIRAMDDWIEIGRLVDPDRLPETDEELHAVRERALSQEEFRGRLVSEDGRATVLVCRLLEDADKAVIGDSIRERVRQRAPGEHFTFAGLPFQLVEISRLVLRDILLLTPLALVLVLLALLVSFRSFRGVLLPLLAAGLSTLWTLGLMSLLGVPFSVVSNVIPVVLLAVGSAYAIHVVSRFGEEAPHGAAAGRAAAERALRRVAVPVALAALTTVAGFVAFIFGAYLTMIRDFGIFSSLGILFALLLSLTFVPAVLSLFPPERRRKAGRPGAGRPAERLINAVTGHPKPVLVIAAGVVLLAAVAAPHMRREVDIISYFHRRTEIRRAEQIMQDRFGGSSTVQVLVRGDLQDPRVLGEMKRLQTFLAAQPKLHHVQSVVDVLVRMNGIITGQRILPDSREKVGNLWFLLEGEETLGQLVGPNAEEGIILATMENQNSRDVAAVVTAVERYLAAHPSETASFALSGSVPIHHRVDQGIRRSLLQSLLIAVALIFLCNLLLLRSAVGALVGLVPILFTLCLLFGVMGLTGIPLDVATVLIGSISLGIGIDYSIHILHRFREESRRGGGGVPAIRRTLATTGRAIAVNVLTVSLGFLALLFGRLIPLQRFAVLIIVTMIGSGLGAVTLLPALLQEVPARFLENTARPEGDPGAARAGRRLFGDALTGLGRKVLFLWSGAARLLRKLYDSKEP